MSLSAKLIYIIIVDLFCKNYGPYSYTWKGDASESCFLLFHVFYVLPFIITLFSITLNAQTTSLTIKFHTSCKQKYILTWTCCFIISPQATLQMLLDDNAIIMAWKHFKAKMLKDYNYMHGDIHS